jgi:bacterioferritin (cytochrome b1)
MSRDQTEETVGRLDAALSDALTVITQFFLHASILKAREHPLARRCYQEWVETMRRSDRLLEAIVDLGGRPSSRKATRLELGRAPRRIFELDIARAERWVALLESTAADCASTGSDETASMLRELLDAESVSLDWRRSQRDELADHGEAVTCSPCVDGALTAALDNVLRAELSAITQVYYHGQLFEAWGAKELGAFLANETWEKTWRSLPQAPTPLKTSTASCASGATSARSSIATANSSMLSSRHSTPHSNAAMPPSTRRSMTCCHGCGSGSRDTPIGSQRRPKGSRVAARMPLGENARRELLRLL